MLFLTKSKSKPVRITGKHEAGNKPTNSSSFKNQSGRHLSHFLKTPLSISLSFSLSLHHVAASPQMIGATEPCERLSEIGRWEMHEISKRMKIFQVFMFQRAKEVVLRHEARVILLSRLLVEMAWNTVYFTGRWVEWDQTSTDLLFTHSQLNTSHCNGAQGDEPRALYHHTVEWVHLSGVGAVSVDDGIHCQYVCMRGYCCGREFTWEQCVCSCRCKPVCMHMWTITDGWFLFCWLCNTFYKQNLLSQGKSVAEATGKVVPEVCYQYCTVLCFISHRMRSSVLSVNILSVGECARASLPLGNIPLVTTLNKYWGTTKMMHTINSENDT